MISQFFYPFFASLLRDENLQSIKKQKKDYHSASNQSYSRRDTLGSRSSRSSRSINASTPILEEDDNVFLPSPKKEAIYETVFLAGSPITRMVSYDELASFFATINPSDDSLGIKSKSLENIDVNMNTINTNSNQAATVPKKARKRVTSDVIGVDTEIENDCKGLGYINLGFVLQSPTEEGQYMMNKSVSSLSSYHSLSFTQPSADLQDINGNVKPDNQAKLIKILNYVLLLIAPCNRRHLHLLLRLFTRIIQNKDLKIYCNDYSSVKDYVSY